MNRILMMAALAFGIIGAPLATAGLGNAAYAAAVSNGGGHAGSGASGAGSATAGGTSGAGSTAAGTASAANSASAGGPAPDIGSADTSLGGHGAKRGTLDFPYSPPDHLNATGERYWH
jgi:hypothetical protein